MSEYNTDKQNKEAADIRMRTYEMILKEQFQLNYFGYIPFSASDNMAVTERHILYSILADQKSEERKAQEEAIKKSQSKKKGWRSR